jgi:hypothetical protein
MIYPTIRALPNELNHTPKEENKIINATREISY